jgi:hypothetical protein
MPNRISPEENRMSAWADQRATSREGVVGRGGDWRMDALVDRLPPRFAGATSYLLQPSSRRVRIPAGVALIGGGMLAFLPVLGVWMIPLGLALLAEDVPALRSSRAKVLDWIERHRPHWLNSRPSDPS